MGNLFEEKIAHLHLERYPHIDNRLQAWSAADAYLYNTLREHEPMPQRVLILNDDTGVLALSLAGAEIVTVHDSLTAKIALEENAKKSGLDLSSVTFVPSTEIHNVTVKEPFSHILCRIPKSTTYLKDQLRSLRHLFTKEATLFSAGMVKHISKSTAKLLEGYVGPTETKRVYKKALLFSSRVTQTKSQPPQIKSFQTPFGSFESFSNTFSNGKIDGGTEELLLALPDSLSGHIVDMGCGYGPVSREAAKRATSDAILSAVDISYMAAASTARNVPEAHVTVSDGLSSFADDSIDWVLSNPPFHQNTTFSVNEGLRLFKQVLQKLKENGTYIMVANSGLNYGPYLSKLFTEVSLLRKSKKYTVFRCTK